MSTGDVMLKEVASVRVAELTASAASYSRHDIGAVVGSLYPELLRRLGTAGMRSAGGLFITYYQDPPQPSDAVVVHAAVPVAAPLRPGGGLAVVDLPAIRPAATITHLGSTEQVIQSLWLLAGWIEENGYRAVGYHRELCLGHQPGEASEGVTELQVAVARDAVREVRGIAMHVLC